MHYRGKIAGLYLSDTPVEEAIAACLFKSLSPFLPTSMNSCETMPPAHLSVSFLGDGHSAYEDVSGLALTVTVTKAKVTHGGVHFDGDGDFVSIQNFAYADDGKFSISFWFTKEACTAGNYEYMYSHVEDENLNIFETTNSNLNIYLGCEANSGGWSTAKGSVIRYNLMDTFGSWATMDYQIHEAGDFDTITNSWVHVILVSTATQLKTFADGAIALDEDYAFYSEAMLLTNNAYKCDDASPPTRYQPCKKPVFRSTMKRAFRKFDLKKDLVIGARADLHKDRHYKGRMAMLNVFDTAVSNGQANCIFSDGDSRLPEPMATTCVTAELDIDMIGATHGLRDKSKNKHTVTKSKSCKIIQMQ